jgi:hypothetical protein
VYLAGLSAGLALFAKQSVGLLVLAGGLATVLALSQLSVAVPSLIRALAVYIAGVGTVVIPVTGYFASRAGLIEFFRQFFSDASAAKGGGLKILVRAIPRIILAPDIPHRRLIEILISFALAVLILVLLRPLRRLNAPPISENLRLSVSLKACLVGGPTFAVLLAAVSLLPIPHLLQLRDGTLSRSFPAPYNTLMCAMYAVTLIAVGIVVLVHRMNEPVLLIAALWAGLLAFGHATSNPAYFSISAPVVVPLLTFILWRAGLSIEGLITSGMLALATGAIVSTLSFTAFVPLKPLPSSGKFAGLWAAPPFHDYVQLMSAHVTPLVTGRRTLFLTPAGPHSAWQGDPVFNVASYYADTYNSRSEDKLFQSWAVKPPVVVIVSAFDPAPGATLLTTGNLSAWLESSASCNACYNSELRGRICVWLVNHPPAR